MSKDEQRCDSLQISLHNLQFSLSRCNYDFIHTCYLCKRAKNLDSIPTLPISEQQCEITLV